MSLIPHLLSELDLQTVPPTDGDLAVQHDWLVSTECPSLAQMWPGLPKTLKQIVLTTTPSECQLKWMKLFKQIEASPSRLGRHQSAQSEGSTCP